MIARDIVFRVGKTRTASAKFSWTYMSDGVDLKLKLLQLRKLRSKSSFITCINGEFTQKFSNRAEKVGQQVIANVRRDLASSNWKLVPRGRVAVKMSFFASDSHIPLVHNLVKYYMDLLNGVFFADDRQVHYLEAYCYQGDRNESKLYLEVERLTTYKQKLRHYFDFKDQFGFDSDSDRKQEIPEGLLNLLDKAQRQSTVLELNRIEAFDHPGDHTEYFGDFIRNYQTWHPYIIDLGDLPRQSGESKEYKQRIRETLRALTKRSNIFNPIVVPVELDVQVTPRTIRLGKDLDNVMIDICRPFTEEVLGEGGYLNAFRVYVTDKLPLDAAGGIRIKLLPFGATQDFSGSIDEVLRKAEEYLDDQTFFS
jgi:Holliday junction resolvase RusA-like endonuclease